MSDEAFGTFISKTMSYLRGKCWQTLQYWLTFSNLLLSANTRMYSIFHFLDLLSKIHIISNNVFYLIKNGKVVYEILPFISGEDAALGDQTYRYLTADEMKSLGDDSLPIDVTRDERMDSNKMIIDSNMLPPQHIEDSISPEHISGNYTEFIKKYTSDNIDINRHPINIG